MGLWVDIMLCLGSSKAGNHDAWRSGRCDYDPASFDSWKVLKSILRVVSCSLHWEQRLSTIRRAYVNWWHEFERERTISFPLLICSGSDDSVSKLSSQRLNQDWHLEFVNEPRPGCKQTLETCWVALFPALSRTIRSCAANIAWYFTRSIHVWLPCHVAFWFRLQHQSLACDCGHCCHWSLRVQVRH